MHLGMLQCLDRPHRLVYVLGEILGMSGPEAADALEIAPDVFRKRLQTRARSHPVVHAFVLRACVRHSRARLLPPSLSD